MEKQKERLFMSMILLMPVYYFMNKKKKPTLINIGTGKDFTIKYYAKLIAKTISTKKKNYH